MMKTTRIRILDRIEDTNHHVEFDEHGEVMIDAKGQPVVTRRTDTFAKGEEVKVPAAQAARLVELGVAEFVDTANG